MFERERAREGCPPSTSIMTSAGTPTSVHTPRPLLSLVLFPSHCWQRFALAHNVREKTREAGGPARTGGLPLALLTPPTYIRIRALHHTRIAEREGNDGCAPLLGRKRWKRVCVRHWEVNPLDEDQRAE